ncbi:MAG: porin [Alistipes sp.]|nr:porin [Alistipes sp.]
MRKFFYLLLVAGLSVISTSAFAQDDERQSINVLAEARVDYQGNYLDGHHICDESGFKGKYINLIVFGDISNSFSYSYRQRLNKAHADATFFDATDWIYLTYTTPNRHWALSAGKQVVGIGGYEYDRAPIDLYFCSEYWNNIGCYQFGASVTYANKSGNDKIMFQACESPFKQKGSDMYAYNLMWYGSHGWFNSIYSVNMMEYMPGEYIYYIALGNEFRFGDCGKLQLDVMNRASKGEPFFFKDFSIMSELSFNLGQKVGVFGKATYDTNKSGVMADYCVMPGTDITRVGAGIEFYPLPKGNRSVRLHANYCYTFGVNGNATAPVLMDNQSLFSVGLKWKIDIASLTKKIVK